MITDYPINQQKGSANRSRGVISGFFCNLDVAGFFLLLAGTTLHLRLNADNPERIKYAEAPIFVKNIEVI